MNPIVAIVGRPNVGKSTLFNRMVRSRAAIVDDTPGVTRDRHYAECTWFGRTFTVIDTGGFDPLDDEGMFPLMREQAQLAIEEADVVLFLLDVRAGVTPADHEIMRILRTAKKPLLAAGNKVEGPATETAVAEFFELGIESIRPVSAEHGTGIQDLIEDLIEAMPVAEDLDELDDPSVTRVAVIGKPNVGKSSFINWLLGAPRLLASDVPGTTRDAIDSAFEVDGRNYLLIDTAGIRRKRSISLRIERFSVVKALKSLERAHVALLVIDANNGVTSQDARLANLCLDRGCAVVVVVNKWDSIEADTDTAGAFVKEMWRTLPFMTWAPAIFTSALTGQRVLKTLEVVDEVRAHALNRIPTGEMNRFLAKTLDRHPPPLHHNRKVKMYYATQVSAGPPTIVVSTNMPDGVTVAWRRFFERQLRENFEFEGTPIRLLFRQRGEGDEEKRPRKSSRPRRKSR
jgi:GTP-binding protein